MITTRQRQFLSPILEWEIIPTSTLVYFEEQLRRRLHSVILDAFKQRAQERGLTQKQLAKRIRKSPVTINRWLSMSSNLTLDSIAVLMVGLGMDFDSFPFTPIEKTVVIAEQEAQKAAEEAATQKLIEKITMELRARLASQIAASVASTKEQKQSSGAAGILLAPLPRAGTTSTSIEEIQKRQNAGSAKIYDFALHQERRTQQRSERQQTLSKIAGVGR
jgi:transcriptional regulator with XRE-family HTH domain